MALKATYISFNGIRDRMYKETRGMLPYSNLNITVMFSPEKTICLLFKQNHHGGFLNE